VTGAIVIGAGHAVPLLVQRFLDGSPVPARRSDLLFPPTGDAPAVAVDRIPDTARICDCNAVVKGQIVEAVLNGARSMPAVCERTRAGTGCGACRPEVQRIVDFVCGQVETAGAARSTGDAALSRSEGEQHASA
jgi:NAD(P)H-nitrite reductase large subunit